MTELELLKMLSGVQSSYIQQADAFREGRLRIVRKKRPVVTALKILSVAADHGRRLVSERHRGHLRLRRFHVPVCRCRCFR